MTLYRNGSHNVRNVYRSPVPGNRDCDEHVAVAFTPEMARYLVHAVNRLPVTEAAYQRLTRIAAAHTKYIGPGGLTSGDCVECGHAWPCPTSVWATSDRDPVLDTWDPADDTEDASP